MENVTKFNFCPENPRPVRFACVQMANNARGSSYNGSSNTTATTSNWCEQTAFTSLHFPPVRQIPTGGLTSLPIKPPMSWLANPIMFPLTIRPNID